MHFIDSTDNTIFSRWIIKTFVFEKKKKIFLLLTANVITFVWQTGAVTKRVPD